jgi:transcriptional regulator with XRE-family HTH domain
MTVARTKFEAWLHEHGLSAREVARTAGLGKSRISAAAAGAQPLTRRMVTLICAAYDCRPSDLTDQRIDRGPGRRWDPREGVPQHREMGNVR